jgi:hypothetical protein
MNRLNGRVATGIMGNPADRDCDFEPSYLVRTPSGNVYIPTGELKTGEPMLSAAQLVEELRYSPEGRGLDSRSRH